MEKKELKEIELRSEELQDVMGKIPPWILRRGIAVLFGVVVVMLTGSAFFTYPDVIQAPIVLTGSTPPVAVVAFASGKLDMLHTQDNQEVKAGDGGRHHRKHVVIGTFRDADEENTLHQ